MLAEWLQYLTTPCPRHLRRLGYLKQMIGMQARHQRCRDAWGPHLRRTRQLILEAADACPGRGKVVILGSGLLLDVPVGELSGIFDEVVLVDILHMPIVRREVAGLANVRLHTHDITGVVEALSRGQTPRPGSADLSADLGADGADLVVSCNILSQLGVLPEPLSPGISVTLMQAHVDALNRHGGTVCLITETAHRLMDGGVEVESSDPLAGVEIPEALKINIKKWDWDFAPRPERHRRYDLIHSVEGFIRAVPN
jgi:hypothetical protein